MLTAFKRDTFRNGVKPNFSDSIKTVYNITQDYSVKADFSYTTNADTIFFNNLSAQADSFIWDYGTGFGSNNENPYYALGENRTINVKLISIGSCGVDSTIKSVELKTVGLQDRSDIFKLYPNPATNQITILSLYQSSDLRIIDLSGRIVYQGSIGKSENIDLSSISAGEYLIELTSGEAVHRERLLISH